MKCIILLIAVCLASLQAQPLFFPRLGGYGHNGFLNGRGYGRGMLNRGANGLLNSGYGGAGRRGFHNLGGHHNSVTSLNRADNSGFHNVGGGGSGANGGYLGDGYNRYLNGANGYGNGFGMGGGGGGGII